MKSGEEIGAHIWIIPDAYLPPVGDENLPGHEATCIVNPNGKTAKVNFTFYFEDREPLKSKEIVINPERTLHLRLDRAKALLGIEVGREIPFSIKVESDVKVIVQHSRLDTRQSNLSYMSSMGYPITK